MSTESAPPAPSTFAVKDCALIAIASGRKVLTLRELRDRLNDVDAGSIYYHFWGNLLHPRFEEREYNNDFASWARHGLHDAVLAEQLAVLDPTEHATLEELRQELLEVVETRLDEAEHHVWLRATRQFEFIRSQIVVFDTHKQISEPAALAELLPRLSTSSVFYHFIDAARRQDDRRDDFSHWLAGFGDDYAGLRNQLANIDPYFGSLSELRQRLATLFADYFGAAA